VVLAGAVVTGVWLLGTARGVWLLRRPKACPMPDSRPLVATQRTVTDTPEAPGAGTVRVTRLPQETLRR
jgi:hypothetical protein